MAKIDFDAIDDWASPQHSVLQGLRPKGVENMLISRRPEFVEDALDILFEHADRDAVIDATLDWARSGKLIGYHGIRLTPEEIESIRKPGLLPLDASVRV